MNKANQQTDEAQAERCARVLRALELVREEAPAEVARYETRVRFAEACCTQMQRSTGSTSAAAERARIARQILDGHLRDALVCVESLTADMEVPVAA